MSGTVALYLNSFSQVDYFGLTLKAIYDSGPNLPIDQNPDSVPQSVTGPLCEPIDATEGDSLGLDKVAFFADPRWQRLWFYCDRGWPQHPVGAPDSGCPISSARNRGQCDKSLFT